MRPSDNDTIVAVATAPGEGAIGIVRLSGSDAIRIAGSCFRAGQALHRLPDRKLSYGQFVVGDQGLDEVLVSVMRGPRSFTGEDVVEFNCHGGPLLLRRAVDELVRLGARHAERGEFTRRAFLNRRLDLARAEAVADMISAPSDLSLQSAYFQLRGGLSERFSGVGEELRQALVLLEAGLDFSEDVSIDSGTVRSPLASAGQDIDRLLSSYRRGKILRDGASVVLVGRPNVGKSSLMNRLLEEDRSIVTEIPGTTRDTIEESVDLDGLRVMLVDTAGLRDSLDPVEREGTRRSGLWIERGQVVLFIVDGSRSPSAEDLELTAGLAGKVVLVLYNKADLGIDPAWASALPLLSGLQISALTGQGIDRLRTRLRELILGDAGPGVDVVTHQRHADALRLAGLAVSRGLDALDTGLPGELVAMEVREALEAIAGIVGETTSDEVLDRIFRSFCIGK